jgi:hypothetical protein
MKRSSLGNKDEKISCFSPILKNSFKDEKDSVERQKTSKYRLVLHYTVEWLFNNPNCYN